jgi:hypothetical protein
LPYPAFRMVNAEPGDGKPSPYRGRPCGHRVQENEICYRDVALTFRSAPADLKVGATKAQQNLVAPRFIGAAILADRAQGPRTYKTGPRYACCTFTSICRICMPVPLAACIEME